MSSSLIHNNNNWKNTTTTLSSHTHVHHYTHLHNQDTRHIFVLIDWPNVFFPFLYSSPPHLLHFLFFITSIGFNLFCVKKTRHFFLFLCHLWLFLYVGSIRVDILLSVSVLSLAFFFFFVVELEIPTLIGLLTLLSWNYYLFGCGSFSHTSFFFYTFINISTRKTKRDTNALRRRQQHPERAAERIQERIFFCLNLFLQDFLFFIWRACESWEQKPIISLSWNTNCVCA